MCRSAADGGRRCSKREHWSDVSNEELLPVVADGCPPVSWDMGSTGSPSPAQLVEVDAATGVPALQRIEQVREIEPAMTGEVLDAARRAGGELADLQSRMKSPASLARKLGDKAAKLGRDPSQVVHSVTDVLRYTVVTAEPARLASTARSTVAHLQSNGWDIREADCKYAEGAPYKGLHILIGKGDLTTEIQFHSEQSIAVKRATHHDYEIARDKSQPPEVRKAAEQRSVLAWSVVEQPEQLQRMKTLGGITVLRPSQPSQPSPKGDTS